MFKRLLIGFSLVSIVGPWLASHAQQVRTASSDSLTQLKTFVVTGEIHPDSVIAVPPANMVRMSLIGSASAAPKNSDSVDLETWAEKEARLNGLESPGLAPWHIAITYDQFDQDGDNTHSGVYEEYWEGAKKYKRIYRSDNLHQTDYATNSGLYRLGDQRWPSADEIEVRNEVVAPFFQTADLEGLQGRSRMRIFGHDEFPCVYLDNGSASSDPMQYCFEPGASLLRYARGNGWNQTVYNEVISFQDRFVARSVTVTDGGKPYLNLRVDKIESLTDVDDTLFSPPSEAVALSGKRATGVSPIWIDGSRSPQFSAPLNRQHFKVEIDLVIGKDGHVLDAKATSGPPEAYKACEDAARKWRFKPFLVLGEPVEVETTTQIQMN